VPVTNDQLREHADAIRGLLKLTIENIIEIGRRLVAAKDLVPHGCWLPWLNNEFGWHVKAASRFMQVYELSLKFDNLSFLNLPVSSAYLLAEPSTPDSVREEVLKRFKAGEEMTVSKVKEAIAAKRAPRGDRPRRRAESRPSMTNGSAPPQLPANDDPTKLEAIRAIAAWLKSFSPSHRRVICEEAIEYLEQDEE
jgi:hypothetical protein